VLSLAMGLVLLSKLCKFFKIFPIFVTFVSNFVFE
jgi:hypothetical protein